ncbi:MAG: hypothetical protein O2877_01550 [bacterium]|nr:hypothetical protein [bacterium]
MFEIKKKSKELETLDEAISRLEEDETLNHDVRAYLEDRGNAFPILQAAMNLPQSADSHAEGHVVLHHVHASLRFLFALLDGKVKLSGIVEFAHMRGFEAELQEIGMVINEHVATLRSVLLGAQLGKNEALRFVARPGSVGEVKGFPVSLHRAWVDDDIAGHLEAYRDIFSAWTREHSTDTAVDLSVSFFMATQISIIYPGFGKYIVDKEIAATFLLIGKEERLSQHEARYAEEVILLLDEVETLFSARSDAGAYERLSHLVLAHGIDVEPFMRILQAASLLLFVVGQKHFSPHGTWHNSSLIENFLHAENAGAPLARIRAEDRRKLEEKRAWNRVFHEEGLDGHGLMVLLGVQPGKELGMLLKNVQAMARGKAAELPKLDKGVRKEILVRIESSRAKMSSL